MSAKNVSQYLIELQHLTDTNLSILKTINESFFSKNDHLTVTVGEDQYVIPSYLSLENKINALQENFYNLINAPKTGEAYFSLDGNTQQIVVQGFNNTPAMSAWASKYVDNGLFGVERNNIFKDFLTPVPYLEFDLSDISDDTTSVRVRKIVPRSEELVATFASYFAENQTTVLQSEPDMRKVVEDYNQGVDYVMYDTTMKLPVRKGAGTGLYVIQEVVSDIIDDNLVEHVTLKLRNDLETPIYSNTLTYKRFEDLVEVPLQVGDEIVTFNESCKMEIEELNSKSNSIKVKILNSVYMNLAGSETKDETKIADISKLKFYRSIDYTDYKKVRVPLEEDKYIFVAIAPLNDRLNTQASWGEGLIIHTEDLMISDGESEVSYGDYYKNNVRNVGDILYEITAMLSDTLSTLNNDEIKAYQDFSPVLDPGNLDVIQINSHLNDSTTVKNIRSLYSQKKQTQAELSEVQEKISTINDSITKINFDDTTNLRSTLTGQLNEYNSRRNDLVSTLTTITNQISIEANNSVVPIENAKYHIRGFVSLKINQIPDEIIRTVDGTINPDIIKGVQVQYRYKNVDNPQGTANSIANNKTTETFIYSDWNNLVNPLRPRLVNIDESTGELTYALAADNGAVNEPSFNQIDIPISQGETVDIRVKFLYDFGWPFIEFTSGWSEIVNVQFPEKFLKDVQILDIIEENNNDIETNRFQNIIDSQGITNHVNDKVVDQDITYYHKPESIASGFYTAERRIIPLRDKLAEIDASVISLIDEVRGTAADDINVSIQNGSAVFNVFLNQNNNISVAAYDALTKKDERVLDGTYIKEESGKVSTILNLILSNPTTHVIKLYSLFPGNDDTDLNVARSYKFHTEEYTRICTSVSNNTEVDPATNPAANEYGIYILQKYDSDAADTFELQKMNQFITFRTRDAFTTNTNYYAAGSEVFTASNILGGTLSNVVLQGSTIGAAMYPMVISPKGLSINANENQNSMYVQIAPGQNIVVPIIFEYNMKDQADDTQYVKTMSFDLRTSLYQDPLTYTFTAVVSKKPNSQDTLIQSTRDTSRLTLYQPTVIK